MSIFRIENEPFIRMTFFCGILAIIFVWEQLYPRKILSQSKLIRWPNNFLIVVINTMALRLFVPITAVQFAIFIKNNHWGLLNQLNLPTALSLPMTLLIFDFAIYVQHVVFHHISFLWRFHRMHHTDTDIDVTTGSRFHPVEILLSMLIKFGLITLIGASAVSVLIFEVVLNAAAMFNHGNIFLPQIFDKMLRLLIVTPDMHRIHHSILVQETNSNFGFNLPWWDRFFGTYKESPRDGHTNITIGLPYFRYPKYQKLLWLLAIPFLKRDR